LNVDYCLGFLRQEENQYLACPPDQAKRIPEKIREVLGYKLGGGALGYVVLLYFTEHAPCNEYLQ